MVAWWRMGVVERLKIDLGTEPEEQDWSIGVDRAVVRYDAAFDERR